MVPLRFPQVSFSNIPPSAHLSVNIRWLPYSFKRFRLFALATAVAILKNWRLLMTPPAILVPNTMSLNFFRILGSSNYFDNDRVIIIALLLPGVNCGSDKRIFRIFSSKHFNCWSSTKISGVQVNFFLNLRRNLDLIFFRALVFLLHLLFSVSKLRRSNIFCHWS